jgi:hypothetical protein
MLLLAYTIVVVIVVDPTPPELNGVRGYYSLDFKTV